jgi:16S rRNA (uracil1498-N3)-methyltransferase
MRLRAGDIVSVFDGRGREWTGRLAAADKSGVRVGPLAPAEPVREPRIPVRLLQAVLKGDHMDAVVRDATMMGIVSITPIVSARTIARAGAQAAAAALQRWKRVALASAKQCRRAVLPEIMTAAPLEEAIAAVRREHTNRRLSFVLAEPSTGVAASVPADFGAPQEAVLASGPEGGWSADELEAFRAAGFASLTLGPLTIRADAAALVAISMLRAAWRDL